jgi:hypothetical protein
LERAALLPGRYELLDGQVVLKGEQSSAHAFAVVQAAATFAALFGKDRALVNVSVEVAEAERPLNLPHADAVGLGRASFACELPLRSSDVLLLMEVADATLWTDLNFKPGLYARAGVPEYWVLDLPTRRLIVHRQITGGAYADIMAYREDETAAPQAAPSGMGVVRVGDLLPPPAPAGAADEQS